MKRKGLITLCVALALVLAALGVYAGVKIINNGAAQQAFNPVDIDTNDIKAPVFSLRDIDGYTVSLNDYEGFMPVVLVYWASWAKRNAEQLEVMDALAGQYDKRVAFLLINQTDGQLETFDSARDFYDGSGLENMLPLFDYDLTVSSQYGVSTLPTAVFIDKEGYVRGYSSGYIGEDKAEGYIKALLGEPVG